MAAAAGLYLTGTESGKCVLFTGGGLLVEVCCWSFTGGGLLPVLEKLQCVLGLRPPFESLCAETCWTFRLNETMKIKFFFIGQRVFW